RLRGQLGGGKDSRQILTHRQLRLFDASLFGAAAARTAAPRAKAPMPSPAVQRPAEPFALYYRLGGELLDAASDTQTIVQAERLYEDLTRILATARGGGLAGCLRS